MNFFGHAALAGHFSERPAFVLGAMLPDFSNMLGLREPGTNDAVNAEGIRFHHLTDLAFHELELFRRWCREARSTLEARGVARGTARAVAHVGIELLLDAALAENAGARSSYLAGLRAGRRAELRARLSWSTAEQDRLGALASTLEERGLVAKIPTPAAVIVERLARVLAGRPRLAIAPKDSVQVAEWVESAERHVVASAPALFATLTREIERRSAA